MNVSVFGMGYVGCVTAACLAKAGHRVMGVEVNPEKLDALRSGSVPFVEPGLSDVVAREVACGRLQSTADAMVAVQQSSLSMICVGTPSLPSGELDPSALEHVCRQIGAALAAKRDFHLVVVRSTVLPSALERCRTLIETAGNVKHAEQFALAVNPEFLREGSAIDDFEHPPFTIVGADRRQDAESVAQVYSHLEAPVFLTDPKTAQLVKYASNLFHATKIVFANEIGRLCKGLGVDSQRMMEIFCADTKLNVSAAYLRPGFAYGGSCLPKDLLAITAFARTNHISLPLVEHLQVSNRQQIELGLQMILDSGKSSVGFLGFSFKPNTDDLRQSPHVALVEALVGKGKQVRIFDPNIHFSRLIGANRRFIDSAVPHVVQLLVDRLEDVLDTCDCLVIANRDPQYARVPAMVRPDQTVVDLVHIVDDAGPGEYRGISW
jgi:GDP-mannose 6-dehydrogenase